MTMDANRLENNKHNSSCPKPPLVSVYITTKNRVTMLKRAVHSVLEQTYPNVEIIISDDGSTDETQQQVNQWCELYTNIVYIRSSTSKGACHARNSAIRVAKGKFITGLDDDDRFTPERLQTFVDAYEPQYAFICSQAYNYTGTKYVPSRYYGKTITQAQIFRRNCVGNQVFFERQKALEAGVLFDESFPAWQDFEFFTHLIVKFGAAKRIHSRTYIMHTDHEKERITNPKRIRQGYRKYLAKYKTLMSTSHRLSLLVNFIVLSNRRLPKRTITMCILNGHFYDLFKIFKRRVAR